MRAFSLTVLEAKTEIMCLRTKGMPGSTAIFSVEVEGQVYNQTNEFVHLGGNDNHNADCSANQVDPDPMCLTSFGDDSTGPPALPCSRDDALETTALRRQSHVSHPWRCAHQQPPMAYSPPVQPLHRRGPPLTSHLFGSVRPKRLI